MTRSDRYLDAVRAFETWRYEQRVKPPDLFSVIEQSADTAGAQWKAAALAALGPTVARGSGGGRGQGSFRPRFHAPLLTPSIGLRDSLARRGDGEAWA